MVADLIFRLYYQLSQITKVTLAILHCPTNLGIYVQQLSGVQSTLASFILFGLLTALGLSK